MPTPNICPQVSTMALAFQETGLLAAFIGVTTICLGKQDPLLVIELYNHILCAERHTLKVDHLGTSMNMV